MKIFSVTSVIVGVFVVTGCTVTQQQTLYFNAGTGVAIAAVKRGDTKKAETEFLIAVQRARRSLGDREVAEALFNLGLFYRQQDRLVEAIGVFQEALPIEVRTFGPEDERTGEVLAALAATYLAGNQLNDATPIIERLRPIVPKYSGSEREAFEMLLKVVEPNPADAEKAKNLAARGAGGDPDAEFQLGVRYELGRGVPQDWNKARELYLSAAGKGCIEATHYLGVVYDKGRGVAVDDKQAAYWYRKAADAGYARAQYNYAVFLAQGRGVDRNVVLALEYLRKADAQHYPEAKQAIRMIERQQADSGR
jgi:tetratricopeptide (TPR) repeat protein